MSTTFVRRFGAAVVALALVSSAVPAYLVLRESDGAEVRWDLDGGGPNVVDGKITYYVHDASASDITGQEFVDAVEAAIGSWAEAPGTRVEFLHDTSRSATTRSGSDRINTIYFDSGNLPPFIFGVTYTSTKNGKVVDTDIELNDDGKTWAVTNPGTVGAPDVQSTVAHEWGHALGLDHVPQAQATMYFAADDGSIQLRSLTPDDLAAVGHLYPNTAFSTDLGAISGTVDIAGAADDRGAQVVAIDVLTGLPAAGDFSEPDGSYVIDGLPEGLYLVVAAPIGTTKIDGNVYNAFWVDSGTGFLPKAAYREGVSDQSSAIHPLAAGESITGIDFSLSDSASPNEPNNTFEAATPIDFGDIVGGRFETSSDLDIYSFEGTAGQSVSIWVHARHVGSALNSRIILRDDEGTTIDSQDDISLDFFGENGVDRDPRLVDVELPSTGTYYIQLEAQSSVLTDYPEDYAYLLVLLAGGGSASSLTSEIVVTPGMIDADGSTTTSVYFTPRTLTGGLAGSDLEVTMTLTPSNGTLIGVTDQGDGTYLGTVQAASSPGTDLVTAKVDGVAVSSATTIYVGPATMEQSTLVASPRRIPIDGSGSTTMTFTPRDVNGYGLGSSRTVLVTDEPDDGATLSGVSNGGDGTYTFTLSGGDGPSTISLPVTVNGVPLNGFTFTVGYPIEEVVVDATLDVVTLLAGSPPAKSVKKLAKAETYLGQAAAFSFPEEGDPLLKTVSKAMKQLEAAAKKGADVSLPLGDLAAAAREAASSAIAGAADLVDETREEKALAKAQALLAKGDAVLELKPSKAAAKYRAAFKQTTKIQ